MPTTTRTAPPPADLDTLNSPRIRFNWGFHAATDDVVRGRTAKDMSDHFDRSYAAGYLAGQLHMASATERPDSSESAWLVRPTCEGKGKHVNPSIDCDGLTAEDFAEDPDFREEYMSGRYDVTCYGCKGKRVVLELDRDSVDTTVLARIDSMLQERDEDEAERAAERRMGA